jgi:hypothetical protein
MEKAFGVGMVSVIFFVFFKLLAAGTAWMSLPPAVHPLK